MLTHPDPQLQILLNDITEQRDAYMVAKANLQVALAAAQAEIAALKAKLQPEPEINVVVEEPPVTMAGPQTLPVPGEQIAEAAP